MCWLFESVELDKAVLVYGWPADWPLVLCECCVSACCASLSVDKCGSLPLERREAPKLDMCPVCSCTIRGLGDGRWKRLRLHRPESRTVFLFDRCHYFSYTHVASTLAPRASVLQAEWQCARQKNSAHVYSLQSLCVTISAHEPQRPTVTVHLPPVHIYGMRGSDVSTQRLNSSECSNCMQQHCHDTESLTSRVSTLVTSPST